MYRSISVHNYDPDWLFTKVRVTPRCWLWQGSMYQNGYGKYGKKGIMAHRIFYTLFKGAVSEDMSLDHLCKNRRCVNPEHLEVVTMVENVLRGDSQFAVNARKTHCKRGHEFTEANTRIQGPHSSRVCKKCRAIDAMKHRNLHRKRG